jgi:1-acyl-sn-glycerol-3-phosphate acyltransferase
LLLVVFSLGIAIGSLLCEKLSRHQVEIGLVPVGALGMTVFALDLYFASRGLPQVTVAFGVQTFVGVSAHWRVLLDLFVLSMSAGLFSVPMYALVQLRSPATHRSRLIAANNILNALFMVVGAIGAGAALKSGVTIPQLFLGIAVVNALVAAYIFTLVPEYFLRFFAYAVTNAIYKLRLVDTQRIPAEGAAVLVANHVSFADAVLIMGASPRPIRFVMDHRIFAIPLLGWFFKMAKAIPVAAKNDHPAIYESAFDAVDQALANEELVCIFPEGAITRNGQLQMFKGGISKILARRAVPVVPLALRGLWGSFFSRKYGAAMSRPFARGMRSTVEICAGRVVVAEDASPERLQQLVQDMLDA